MGTNRAQDRRCGRVKYSCAKHDIMTAKTGSRPLLVMIRTHAIVAAAVNGP